MQPLSQEGPALLDLGQGRLSWGARNSSPGGEASMCLAWARWALLLVVTNPIYR